MLRHQLKLLLRNAGRQKKLFLISLLNLALGVAFALMLGLYAFDELSYDSSHKNAGRIARIVSEFEIDGRSEKFAVTSEPLAMAVRSELEEVVSSTRVETNSLKEASLGYEGKKFDQTNVFVVDSTFMDIFSYHVISGSKRPLLNPNEIVLTEKVARSIFGESDPVGKIVTLNGSTALKVTAVIRDLDSHSHLQFSSLISWSTFKFYFEGQWTWAWNYTYVLLDEADHFKDFSKKLQLIVDHHIEKPAGRDKFDIKLSAQPLEEIHLYSNLQEEISPNGDITQVNIIIGLTVAFLCLFCTNYINTSIVISTNRAKEQGIKKALGLSNSQSVILSLIESSVVTWLATGLGVLIAFSCLPLFNSWANKNLNFTLISSLPEILVSIAMVFLLAALAGSYSAFYLSSLKPSAVLRSAKGPSHKSPGLQNVLVCVQFVISIAGIIVTLVVVDQLRFIKKRGMGFNHNNVLVIRIPEYDLGQSVVLRDKLLRESGVVKVGLSNTFVGIDTKFGFFVEDANGQLPIRLSNGLYVDSNFLDLLEIKLVSGRNFDLDLKSDYDNATINEEASSQFGWDEPLGKKIRTTIEGAQTGEVIGYVKDFHINSLRKQIEPLVINLFDGAYANYVYIKVAPNGDYGKTIGDIKSVFKDVYGAYPLEVEWLEEVVGNLYSDDVKLNKALIVGSAMIILISCFGLYSLSSFLVLQKQKEFAIRKVFGSSRIQIFVLHFMPFIKLLMIANVIGWIVGYAFGVEWLSGFAYTRPIILGNFVLSSLMTAIVVVVVVTRNAHVASGANPAAVLRGE